MLEVVYMSSKHEVVFCLKADKGLVYKAKKYGVKFFKKDNEGLVYKAKKQGAVDNFGVRQEPCQVEDVGEVVMGEPIMLMELYLVLQWVELVM